MSLVGFSQRRETPSPRRPLDKVKGPRLFEEALNWIRSSQIQLEFAFGPDDFNYLVPCSESFVMRVESFDWRR